MQIHWATARLSTAFQCHDRFIYQMISRKCPTPACRRYLWISLHQPNDPEIRNSAKPADRRSRILNIIYPRRDADLLLSPPNHPPESVTFSSLLTGLFADLLLRRQVFRSEISLVVRRLFLKYTLNRCSASRVYLVKREPCVVRVIFILLNYYMKLLAPCVSMILPGA